jgi:hypothetical protein
MKYLKVIVTVPLVIVLLLVGCSSESRDWETAKKSNTVEAYEKYLKDYPEGDHSVEAKKVLDNRAWEQARKSDSVEEYKTYLELFPEGNYRAVAKDRLRYLKIKEMPVLEGVLDGALTMGFLRDSSSLMLEARELSWCLSFPLQSDDCSVQSDYSHSRWEVTYTSDTIFVGFDETDGARAFEDGKTYRAYGSSADLLEMSDVQRNRALQMGIRVLKASMIERVTDTDYL